MQHPAAVLHSTAIEDMLQDVKVRTYIWGVGVHTVVGFFVSSNSPRMKALRFLFSRIVLSIAA